ncbi:arabinose ABC transporter permease [Paenibacillus selenitireducens]|uniref:Arabinose ABC transporter permease n=1 Tax=Paenibacillus selenitireducens TaxID=1324314 RepID=A0A1T2X611_9BACL|nr:MFS transporter [Paenibacillus selenitireducens]OPA75245.1 arabinose ABC transporter permease [Paenibacillus selenitireducens]
MDLKYKFMMMFMIVLCGMISIAAFNPIIGPLSRMIGLNEIESGCLVSVTGMCWLIGGFFWEKCTFMSRKKILAMIMFVYVLTLIGFGLLADAATNSSTWNHTVLFWIFFVLRAVAGFFFGGIPAQAQAYVMGWTTADTRTKGMALFGAANGLGFVLGPALSGWLASISLTAPMYAASTLLVLIALWFIAYIPDAPVPSIQKQRKLSLSPMDARIRLYLWIGFVLSIALNMVQVTIGFYVQDQLGYNAAQTMQFIGLGLALSGVMVVASQVIITRYLKSSPRLVLLVGLSCVAVGLLGFLLFIHQAMIAFIILGFGIGFTMLGYSAGASMSVQHHEQRSVATYIAALQGGGAFVGPVIGTILYTSHILLPYGLGISLMMILLLFVIRKNSNRQVAQGIPQNSSHD